MPSIAQMFGASDPAEHADSPEFNLDEFFRSAEGIMAEKTEEVRAEADAMTAPEATVPGPEPEDEPEVPPAPPAPVAATADPLSELAPERRAQLLALDDLLRSDPTVAQRVFAAAQPSAPAEPSLPPEIDPDSTEARLWMDNRRLESRLEELTGAVSRVALSNEQTQAQNHAANAIRSFAGKYVGKLSPEDIQTISQQAGQSGMSGALVASAAYRGNPQAAFEKALEDTLWTNETFRSRIIDAPTPTAAGDTAESVARKAALNALSSAASPIAAQPAKREPLESREDGRLTPQSRQRLIQDLATNLARSRNMGLEQS